MNGSLCLAAPARPLRAHAVSLPMMPPRAPTPRQLDVLRLLADGLTLAEAAYRLGITRLTAKSHLANARERMGGLTRTQLLLWLEREGLIQVPQEA